jgi:hypothetical protein
MLANMRATGHSSEEVHTTLAQFFLNCPAVDPDAKETKVNIDEFEHTEVEQQARRDQQRVLMALARRNQQPVPMADVEHFDLHMDRWGAQRGHCSTRRWIYVLRRAP